MYVFDYESNRMRDCEQQRDLLRAFNVFISTVSEMRENRLKVLSLFCSRSLSLSLSPSLSLAFSFSLSVGLSLSLSLSLSLCLCL